MLRRILPILLGSILLLFSFAACGKSEEATNTSDAPSTTTVPVSTTSKKLKLGINSEDEGWSFWSEF